MKIYFIGKPSELPTNHKARKKAIFTTRWMDAIRAGDKERVIVATFNEDHIKGICRVASGSKFPSSYVRINKTYKKRGVLHIVVLHKHVHPQRNLPM